MGFSIVCFLTASGCLGTGIRMFRDGEGFKGLLGGLLFASIVIVLGLSYGLRLF